MSNKHFRTIKKASLISGFINALLAILKIATGFISHSQALIADGIHSFSDLMADGLVIISAKWGSQAPDHDRPYGYRRIETMGTIIIALLIITIGAGILFNAIHTFRHHSMQVKTTHSFWVILAASLSVIANEGLFHFLKKQGGCTGSPLLLANAWHNRSDALVSLMVLLTAILSALGIHNIDHLAAFIIAVLIIKMGGKMIWRCMRELIDTAADEETQKKIESIIRQTAGVVDIHHLRTRLHGNKILLDAHIQVNNDITVSEGHYIGDTVHQALHQQCDDILDITIHIDAENDEYDIPANNAQCPPRLLIETQLNRNNSTLPQFQHMQTMQLHYLKGECTVELFFNGPSLTESEIKQYEYCLRSIKKIRAVKMYYQPQQDAQ